MMTLEQMFGPIYRPHLLQQTRPQRCPVSSSSFSLWPVWRNLAENQRASFFQLHLSERQGYIHLPIHQIFDPSLENE